MHHPTDSIIHTTAFVTPVVEHWLEREITYYKMLKRFQQNTMPQTDIDITRECVHGTLLVLVLASSICYCMQVDELIFGTAHQ